MSIYVISYYVGHLGELVMEDVADPGKLLHLTAGDVTLSDEGTVSKISTPTKARCKLPSNSNFSGSNLSPLVFGVAYVPAPLVLSDLRVR